VTRVLSAQLFGAESKAVALRAFNSISDCWVSFTGANDVLKNDYLRRRNFTRLPWFAIRVPNSPIPSYITGGFGSAESFYTYTYKPVDFLGRTKKTIPKSSFLTEIARIRRDAEAKYGPNYDKPRPCPQPD
jgi:hypothetical protein